MTKALSTWPTDAQVNANIAKGVARQSAPEADRQSTSQQPPTAGEQEGVNIPELKALAKRIGLKGFSE